MLFNDQTMKPPRWHATYVDVPFQGGKYWSQKDPPKDRAPCPCTNTFFFIIYSLKIGETEKK